MSTNIAAEGAVLRVHGKTYHFKTFDGAALAAQAARRAEAWERKRATPIAIRIVDDVRFAREQLNFRINEFLRQRGWKHTCNAPGSLWLWERTIEDGRTVLVDRETALNMEAWCEAMKCECIETGAYESDSSNCPVHKVSK